MRVEDMILVSIDDHLIEPPDMFEHHMPERYKDTAPKVLHLPDGTDRWVFQGNETGHFALGAVATWPKAEWSMDPGGYADMRPGCYTVHERVRDMNAGGVLSSMSFPTFAGFAGNHLARGETKALTAAAFSAWNDWHLDEWCAAYPGRLIPLGILPLRDPDAMVKEVHRLAAKGCTAISLPETPHIIGLPSFYSGYWDPVLSAMSDEGIVGCLHIGMAFNAITLAPETPDHLRVMMAPQLAALTMSDLFTAGVFRKFPDLHVALSEGGIGWIPFYLDKLDRHVVNQAWTGLEVGTDHQTPTEVFRRQVLGCFITDESALRLRDRIGIDNIAWESDYPHSDSVWPLGPETLFAECQSAGLSDAEIHRITWENASRVFRLDPFAHLRKDQATVGALRAATPDVDTTETSKYEYRRRYEERQQATVGAEG